MVFVSLAMIDVLGIAVLFGCDVLDRFCESRPEMMMK